MRAHRLTSYCAPVWLVASLGSMCSGQIVPAPPAEMDAAQRHRVMREIADHVALQVELPRERPKAERLEEPIYKFVDPARRHGDGAVWAWGRTGRPAALLTLATYFHGGVDERWLCEFTSLAATTLVGTVGGGEVWAPAEPGLRIQSIPMAATPADDDRTRLRQMKALARRFKGFELFAARGQTSPERYELRLLTQPIHRYAEPASGLVDGGIFLLSYGANPEVALVIEANRAGGKTPAWQYGLARIAGAELHVNLDEREVWRQPATYQSTPRDVYWCCNKPLDGGR